MGLGLLPRVFLLQREREPGDSCSPCTHVPPPRVCRRGRWGREQIHPTAAGGHPGGSSPALCFPGVLCSCNRLNIPSLSKKDIHKNIHILTPGPCEYVPLLGGAGEVSADVIKWGLLRWGDYPAGPECHHMHPYKREAEEGFTTHRRGRGHVTRGAEASDAAIGQGRWKPAESLEEARADSLPPPSWEARPASPDFSPAKPISDV